MEEKGIVYTSGNRGESHLFVSFWFDFAHHPELVEGVPILIRSVGSDGFRIRVLASGYERSEDMTVHTPTGGRSRESSAMGESLTERRRVQDDVLRYVNCFCRLENY